MEITRQNGSPFLSTPNGGAKICFRPGFVISNLVDGTRTYPSSLAMDAEEGRVSMAAGVIDKSGRNFDFSLNGTRNIDTFAGLFSVKMEKGFVNNTAFSLAFEFPYNSEDYLFAPGMVYGNTGFPSRDLLSELTFFSTAMPLPCIGVFHRDKNAAFLISTASGSVLGSNFITFRHNREEGTGSISITLSAGRKDAAALNDEDVRRQGYEEGIGQMYLGESGALSIPVCISLFDCGSTQGFFEAFRHIRMLSLGGNPVRNRLPLSHAVSLVEENLNNHHWYNDFYLSCNFINASGTEPKPGEDHFPGSWYLRHGEHGGAPLAYAMSLSDNDTSHERGIRMLDFIADKGIAPSGIFYSMHNQWSGFGDPPWTHIRGAVDCCFFMLRACQQHGTKEHPQWRKAAMQCCDALATIYKDNGEFGYSVARNAELAIWEKGSAAGCLAIACLALAHRIFNRQDYLEVACDAADGAGDLLATGAVGGSCMECGHSPDSASLSALMEAFAILYEETMEKCYLEKAIFAADQFSSYVMAKSVPITSQSPLQNAGIETRGSVIRNINDSSIGPGPAASSLSVLLRLYQITGDEWLLELLSDVIRALPQYVSEFHAQISELRRGMVASELHLNSTGLKGVEPLSKVAGALPLLLAWHELPGIYIDPPRSNYIVLDHLNAGINFEHSKVFLSNPTSYRAAGRIVIELGIEEYYDLAPGESTEISY